MRPLVEPVTGHPLDRLITALLNVTGMVHRVIHTVEPRPTADGVEIIGTVADRLRCMLARVSEHNSDAELELATRVVAETTLLSRTSSAWRTASGADDRGDGEASGRTVLP